MKRLALGIGLSGLLAAACSDDATTNTNVGGSSTGGGMAGMSSGGSSAGTTAGMAGASAGNATAGSGAGSGGAAGGSGGSGGAAGGSGGTGGSGGSGGAGGSGTCTTTLGKALQFDSGKVDIFSGDLGMDLPGGNTNRTVELWAKFTGDNSWTAEHTMIETGKRVSAGNQVLGIDLSGRVDADTGQFGPYTNGLSDNNSPNGVNYDAPGNAGWLHLAWSFDTNTGLSFTINGVSFPVQMGGQKVTLDLTPGIVTLGASQNFGMQGWGGVMDEVKIWSVSKTPAEVLANMKVVPKADTAGLVAYYRFNEGSGTFTDDESKKASHRLSAGGGNDAQPMWVDSDVPGPFTCAP
jgi:hypothetical protein